MLQRLAVDFVEIEDFEKEGERVLADYWSLAGGAQSVLPERQRGETGAELPYCKPDNQCLAKPSDWTSNAEIS